MTIDFRTLHCAECGSSALERTGPNQYRCQHCGSVSIVEDDVSQRLERMLGQLKDAATAQSAADGAAYRQRVVLGVGIAGSLLTAIVLLVAAASGAFRSDAPTPARTVAATPALLPSPSLARISPDGLKLGEARQVLVGSGSSARARLLVMARNETGRPLERPSVLATFYDADDTKLGSRSESLPLGMLAPGESAPLLIDLPGDKTVARQALSVERIGVPSRTVDGPRLAFSRLRLVQQGDGAPRLVGRIDNARRDAALAGCEVLVTLYDDGGQVIGTGHGYAQASEIAPGGHSTVDLRIDRFGGAAAAIAAWDYRIDYRVLDGDGGRTQVLSADRVIRTAGGPELFNSGLHLATEDLLATDAERFDAAQLELLPLAPGHDNIQRPVYLTELVNHSKDAIAVAPGAVISRFDGNRADGSTVLAGPAYLYPGERYPIELEPGRGERITQTRIEWKPMRRAALPGPRAPLEVQVSDTRAQTGSVLLNFSQRFLFKYVEVQGRVKNPGPGIVRKARVWVSLRDREGRLAGFKEVDNLPAIAPGDTVPFQVSIDQHGRDFASVATLYQSE